MDSHPHIARVRESALWNDETMQVPEVRYTKVDGLSIAWQQFGTGPDVLIIPGLVSNVELVWEHEFYHRVNDLMAKHMRTTIYDKRGMGLSERTQGHQTVDQRMSDVLAVMDAAGLERAHILGASEGGLIAQMFAARYPERVDKLVIANSLVAGMNPDPDHQARSYRHLSALVKNWGRDGQAMVDGFSPTHSNNESFVRWFARFQRLSGTQLDVIRQIEDVPALLDEDPEFLSRIAAPTLVVNSSRDQITDPALGDWLHDRIGDSTRIMIDSDDHFVWLGDHGLAVTKRHHRIPHWHGGSFGFRTALWFRGLHRPRELNGHHGRRWRSRMERETSDARSNRVAAYR